MMKKRILITCKMIEDETRAALEVNAPDLEVVWMDKKLHDQPDRLRDAIQDEIDKYQDYDEIMLGFGLCGNGVLGVSSANTSLVIPRFDDCINQMLFVDKRNSRGLTDGVSMYLTHGWTQDDEAVLQKATSIWEDYADDEDEEMAQDILNMMFGQYQSVAVIDTGCYELGPVMEYAKEAADMLKLECKVVPGSNRVMQMLITGKYDRNFIVLQPGQVVDFNMFD